MAITPKYFITIPDWDMAITPKHYNYSWLRHDYHP